MATMAELSENSHPGFEGIKAALCLASIDANSNPASGMEPCLRPNGTGSRCSGKERDNESGLDYFLARYYSGAQGRFTSVDPSGLSVDTSNPQSWNRYSYTYNNPLKYVDSNGKWPTPIHNQIIEAAFPGLSSEQRELLKAASKYVDRLSNQTQAGSHDHAMKIPGEDDAAANLAIDRVTQAREEAATRIQKGIVVGNLTDINSKALYELGLGLHTVMDRTSPTHTGPDGKPLPNYGIPTNRAEVKALQRHLSGEQQITPAQMDAVVKALRESFEKAFGASAASQAAQHPKEDEAKKRRWWIW